MELEDRYRVYNYLSTLRVIDGILEENLPGLRVPKKNESAPRYLYYMLTTDDSADNLLNLDAMVYNSHKKWCFLLTELLLEDQ
jgi:hypothetical protein